MQHDVEIVQHTFSHPYPSLARTVLTYPAIDNHAHPLLTAAQRDAFPFESLVSEAAGPALADVPHTLAFHNATARLAELYGIPPFVSTPDPEVAAVRPQEQIPETAPGTGRNSTWDAIKAYRTAQPYEELCARALRASHIETILHDDGLGGVDTLCESRAWHDQFVRSPCKRIMRVETVAQDILAGLFDEDYHSGTQTREFLVSRFFLPFLAELHAAGRDPVVVGFKSVVCYRTGLAVKPLFKNDIAAIAANDPATLADIFSDSHPYMDTIISRFFVAMSNSYRNEIAAGATPSRSVRISFQPVNDWIVGLTMVVAGIYGKPVQFHTGLGDSDITLALSSPAHLQPLIVAHPHTQVVLLHSSYPYTRDAGYLCSTYPNVWLDFGEVFAMISTEGSRDVIRQILEIAPTNKIMWSSDGHWWPESFYLGSLLAREALLDVLTSSIRTSRLPVSAAIEVARNALFHTANRVYKLGLPEPEFQL